MQFLKNLLASVLGTFIAIVLAFVFLFIIIAGVASSIDSTDEVNVKEKSILTINLQKPVTDRSPNQFELETAFDLDAEAIGLDKILASVRAAKDDERIEGISIEHTFLQSGMSQTQAMRDALSDFKQSGKFIYAYHDFYTQKDYYFASVADSVFVHPEGGVDISGLASEVLYLKKFQDITGVQMQVIRSGAYKSAVEPFLRDEMSDENRQQIKSLLDSFWKEMLVKMEERTALNAKKINQIASDLDASVAANAVKIGVVDNTLLRNEYRELLRNQMELGEDDKLNTIDIEDYQQTVKSFLGDGKDRIAVVYAQGEIIYGEGGEFQIGQELFIRTLKKIKENDRTKAVVIRVNSPGGSSLSSELIYQEIQALQEEMPVVVSMGDVAASGGYYIAAGADYIFAEPTTITGSIGVFGILPLVEDLAENWGVRAEQVSTHPNALLYSPMKSLTPLARQEIKQQIKRVYSTFLERVASGRNMSVEEVDEVAQGRVWSGSDAYNIGLVDALGGLEEAVAYAAKLAETDSYRTTNYPKFSDDFESFLQSLQPSPFGHTAIGKSIQYFQSLFSKQTTQIDHIQARIPFDLNIR
ncbi:MAG: signal peptide peptidase SppA [Flavobacteriaceae bacterium]|nr:signal peptide peptidase SppA [Flavobacteriaceae bacterium]